MLSTEIVLNKIKALAGIFENGSAESLMQYADARIFNIRSTNEVLEQFISNEGVTGTRYLDESDTGDEYKKKEGYKTTVDSKCFGGYIEVTEKLRKLDSNDSTVNVDNFLASQSAQVMYDNEHFFVHEIFEMYNDAFTGAKFLAPDTVALCGTHTWKTGGTFTNKGTKKMSTDLLDDVDAYAGSFTSADGKPMPLNFDIVLVKKGGDASRAAKKLLLPFNAVFNRVGEVNLYEGKMTIVETPYITSGDAVFFIDSSKMTMDKGAIYVGIEEFPTFREPVLEKNGNVSTRISGYFKNAIINMPYCVYGSDGSTGAYPSAYVETHVNS
jgi:hypothetical protein